jgi:hypothetical protein
MLEGFPFTISGFHADTGSEYINHQVAGRLENPRIELTQSRRRQWNDNGLAETKNGTVVRKCFATAAALCTANQSLMRRIPQPLPQLAPILPVRRQG